MVIWCILEIFAGMTGDALFLWLSRSTMSGGLLEEGLFSVGSTSSALEDVLGDGGVGGLVGTMEWWR